MTKYFTYVPLPVAIVFNFIIGLLFSGRPYLFVIVLFQGMPFMSILAGTGVILLLNWILYGFFKSNGEEFDVTDEQAIKWGALIMAMTLFLMHLMLFVPELYDIHIPF
ncbi:MAG: hypothetical protein IJR45_03415 [Firmicutes bacterium]|nr:hypothetical protein [Bacillota bacterium]MBQ9604443.1 hypothetical protein [Bacillota bacterium]